MKRPTLLLAHGAGAPMDSDWMNLTSELLESWGIKVVRFEFPYMERRRISGVRCPPDRLPVLLSRWKQALLPFCPQEVFIGGKSLGGRCASLIADEVGVRGLVCFGFPFHPPGRDTPERYGHLLGIRTPTLILQGERDPFGSRREFEGKAFSDQVEMIFFPDANHSLQPRVRSGHSLVDHLACAAALIATFVGLGG